MKVPEGPIVQQGAQIPALGFGMPSRCLFPGKAVHPVITQDVSVRLYEVRECDLLWFSLKKKGAMCFDSTKCPVRPGEREPDAAALRTGSVKLKSRSRSVGLLEAGRALATEVFGTCCLWATASAARPPGWGHVLFLNLCLANGNGVLPALLERFLPSQQSLS